MVKDWKAKLGQIPPPMEKVTRTYQPSLIMSHGKVVRYDLRSMGVWRAVVSTTYTILTEWDTWYLMVALSALCCMTFAVVIGAGWESSIQDDGSVTQRVKYLLGFILSGHVTLVVNRWDNLRNTTFGILWGSLENLTIYSYMSFPSNNVREMKWKAKALRYSRLCMMSLFHASRAEDNLSLLKKQGLLTEKERPILQAARIETRPLIPILWIYQIFQKAKAKGHQFPIEGRMLIQNNVSGAREGVVSTLNILNTPYPYNYMHLVHWSVQIFLFILAVETGVILAALTARMNNGNKGYSYDDDKNHWPSNIWVWYTNTFIQTTVQNVVFALFAHGLLRMCDKMMNPFNDEEFSFPEYAYDLFIHNNCKAMLAGLEDLSDGEEGELSEPTGRLSTAGAAGPDPSIRQSVTGIHQQFPNNDHLDDLSSDFYAMLNGTLPSDGKPSGSSSLPQGQDRTAVVGIELTPISLNDWVSNPLST